MIQTTNKDKDFLLNLISIIKSNSDFDPVVLRTHAIYKHAVDYRGQRQYRYVRTANDLVTYVDSALLHFLYRTIPLNNLSHGFYPRRNIFTNASVHSKNPFILKTDIESFFTHCRRDHVINILDSKKHLFSDPSIVDHLVYIIRIIHFNFIAQNTSGSVSHRSIPHGELPQGLPASPFLANMTFDHIDPVMVKLLRKKISDDILYTRYADDITLSSKSPAVFKSISLIDWILKNDTLTKFYFNHSKTIMAGPGDRKIITGLNINAGRPTVSKTFRRKIRAILHRVTKCGWGISEKNLNKVEGLVNHINIAHPQEAARYRNQINKIRKNKTFAPDKTQSRKISYVVYVPSKHSRYHKKTNTYKPAKYPIKRRIKQKL